MDQLKGNISLSKDSCVSTNCTTSSTCSLTAQNTVLTSNIAQSLLLTHKPIIIIDNSMLTQFLGQATALKNFCSNQHATKLLFQPPKITVLPEQSTEGLTSHLQVMPRYSTASTAPLAISSAAHNSVLLSTGKETTAETVDSLALSEHQTQSSPEVLVVPDSPQCDSSASAVQSDSQAIVEEEKAVDSEDKAQTSEQKEVSPGEKILDTLASTIMSLSKPCSAVTDTTPSKLELRKPTKLLLNSTQFDPKPLLLPQNSQNTSFKVEQLTEESDEELELPKEETTLSVYNATSNAQEQTLSPALNSIGNVLVESELTYAKPNHQTDSIQQKETAQCCDSQQGCVSNAEQGLAAVASARSAEFEESSAKRLKIETVDSTHTLHGQSSSGDCILPLSHSAIEILTPPNHTASLTETTLAYPHEPSTLADDGLATLDQALPMECAQERSLIPNLPHHAHQDGEDSDNSDSEDEGERGIPLPEQACLPDGGQEGIVQTDLRVETAAFEHQMVPDLSLDLLFPSKSLYQEEHSKKLQADPRGSTVTSLEDCDFEINSNSSVLNFALKGMESRKSTATQTVNKSPDLNHFLTDGVYSLNTKTPFNKHPSFSFNNDQGSSSEFCATTRLNLNKPRLRLGLSRKARTNRHK